MITTYGRAVINAEIFDAFGGRSTTAQEVSKSTEVQYTTLQLREQQPAKSPAREAEYHRRIRRTIARKLLHRRTHGTRVLARARIVRTEKRKLRIPKMQQQCRVSSESPPVVFLLFFSPSSLFLSFFISNGSKRTRCRMKKVGTSSRPTASEFRRVRAGIHKIFRSMFNDDVAVFRARQLYTGPA